MDIRVTIESGGSTLDLGRAYIKSVTFENGKPRLVIVANEIDIKQESWREQG